MLSCRRVKTELFENADVKASIYDVSEHAHGSSGITQGHFDCMFSFVELRTAKFECSSVFVWTGIFSKTLLVWTRIFLKTDKKRCVFKNIRIRVDGALGCFSSKTRTSLKTQLLFHVLEHSNFPAFSLPESYSQRNKFPKNCLHSRISIICECVHIAFCFPSRHPILSVRPSKVQFSGCQFQNRTYDKSLETCKSFEVDFSL